MNTRVALLLIYPLIIVGLVLTALRAITCIAANPSKAWSIYVLVDETCNVDANGRVNQTISARAALAQQQNKAWGCILCKLLGEINKNHCENALNGVGNGQ